MNSEESYNPYCSICGSCGEDGCCSATTCKQDPNGKYCNTYLKELKFGYIMYHKLMKLIDDDPKYDNSIGEIWNKTWDDIFIDKKDNEQTD